MAANRQFCTFYLNQMLFGIELQSVQEVICALTMTQVPLAPKVVSGLINLRGQIVTAVDLRRRFDMDNRPESQLPMNVVVRTPDGAVSLLVDEIGEVLEVDENTFERTPETLQGVTRQLIRGIYKLEKRLLLVLDIDRALESAAVVGAVN